MTKKQFLILLVMVYCFSLEGNAQLFKKKKKKNDVLPLFTVEQELTPEERQKALQKQLVSPTRKKLNRFNLNIETGVGFFLIRVS